MLDERFNIEHRADEHRYVLSDGETEIGEEVYADVDDQRVLFHTVVSEEYGGQGLASALVRFVADDIAERGLALVPVCPYVKAWVEKHPDDAGRVVQPEAVHLRAVAEARR